MARPSYSEQLADPRWKARREEVLNASGWRCSCCAKNVGVLHVHHKRYIRGRLAWEYEDRDLVVVCEACHDEQHEARAALDAVIASVPATALVEITDLVAGFCARQTGLTHFAAISDPTTFVIGEIADRLRSAPWDELRRLRGV
jgi:hypothetical protein